MFNLQVAIIEPGAKLFDVDVATVKHGLAVTLGNASYVGFGGQALDLGMGFLGRSFGYLTDNIIEYGEIICGLTRAFTLFLRSYFIHNMQEKTNVIYDRCLVFLSFQYISSKA